MGQGRPQFTVELSHQQTLAWDALHDPKMREVGYGGGKGGGKSVLGCVWVYCRCLELIREFHLKPSDNPIKVGFMGRKKGVDFRATTLETWKRFIPKDAYYIREQVQEIVVHNTVKIQFGGLDVPQGETIREKFNSAEFAFVFIDQAEETVPAEVDVLRGAMRLIIPDPTDPADLKPEDRRKPHYMTLYTANPARCWLRDEFISAPTKEQVFIRALPNDNPYLGEEYVKTLQFAFRHRPELLSAYLGGNWDSFEGNDQLIKEAWIRNAQKQRFHHADVRRVLVCDPARFGDDETVIYLMEETNIVKQWIYGQKDTAHTVNLLFVEYTQNDKPLIVIDSCGIGGPMLDRLQEMGANAIGINAAENAENVARYVNRRAEIWVKAADKLADGQVSLNVDDNILIGQLCTPKYTLPGGRYLIQDKKEIKGTLGRSPDRADCYVMGLEGLEYAQTERARKRRDRWGEDDKSADNVVDAMAS